MRKIYAVYDNKAGDITGPLFLAAADAVAIRNYSDVASQPETTIGQHPTDYDLVTLGTLMQNPEQQDCPVEIDPTYRVVLTGSQWLALHEKTTGA